MTILPIRVPRDGTELINLALPGGRISKQVIRLLSDVGMDLIGGGRSYRPQLSTSGSKSSC